MSDTKLNEIDKAIAAVKARKAAKEAAEGKTEKTSAKTKAPAAKAEKVPADKEAAKAAREKERAEAKAKRDAEREAKKAAKAAKVAESKKPAHMSKVLKAAEKLPSLKEDAQLIFSDATSNLSAAQVAALALHLQHFNRVKATERALEAKIEEGDEVEIVGGDPRFIGKTGTVSKAQRIRCYVEVDGLDKPVYCFTSDVSRVQVEAEKSTGTEG